MMTGSIRQRQPGSWELRVYVGLDPDTRQRRYATRTVRGSRRAATAALAELVEDATYSRLRAGTVGELLERWVATASSGWSASTVRETNSLMRCHFLPHFGHLPVTKLTAVDIDDVYSQLLRRGGRDNRPLSPGTVHRVHVVLHRALSQAARWEWIWFNPAAMASPPRVEPAGVRPPSVEQVRQLLEVVRDDDVAFFTYLHLAVITGARRSQLLALRANGIASSVIGPRGCARSRGSWSTWSKRAAPFGTKSFPDKIATVGHTRDSGVVQHIGRPIPNLKETDDDRE